MITIRAEGDDDDSDEIDDDDDDSDGLMMLAKRGDDDTYTSNAISAGVTQAQVDLPSQEIHYYQELTIPEIKVYLDKLGCKKSGTKALLLQRLEEALLTLPSLHFDKRKKEERTSPAGKDVSTAGSVVNNHDRGYVYSSRPHVARESSKSTSSGSLSGSGGLHRENTYPGNQIYSNVENANHNNAYAYGGGGGGGGGGVDDDNNNKQQQQHLPTNVRNRSSGNGRYDDSHAHQIQNDADRAELMQQWMDMHVGEYTFSF